MMGSQVLTFSEVYNGYKAQGQLSTIILWLRFSFSRVYLKHVNWYERAKGRGRERSCEPFLISLRSSTRSKEQSDRARTSLQVFFFRFVLDFKGQATATLHKKFFNIEKTFNLEMKKKHIKLANKKRKFLAYSHETRD